MSINHQYSTSDLSQPPQWWSHYSSGTPSPPPIHPMMMMMQPPFDLNNNHHENDDNTPDDQSEEEIPKERLFEKALTPSDVGKLNRLVIPKQHAERHFPLNGSASEPGENGLLLGFEDENGKSWRFRYSYWNSSQSYVLTKGWSRFVKEKRLDAGDVVVFARHRLDTARFFIGWRRRASGGADSEAARPAAASWGRVFKHNPGQQQYTYPSPGSSSLPYQPEFVHAETVVQEKQTTTTTTGGGSGNSKWLRLFGVNLECHQADAEESDSSTPHGSPMSSNNGQAYYYSNNHMDISFSGGGGGDAYRQG